MRIELSNPELPLRPQVELDGVWHRYRGPASSGDWTLRDAGHSSQFRIDVRGPALGGLLTDPAAGLAGFHLPIFTAAALTAAATFSILDTYVPSLAVSARTGAGFGIGANLVGFPTPLRV